MINTMCCCFSAFVVTKSRREIGSQGTPTCFDVSLAEKAEKREKVEKVEKVENNCFHCCSSI